MLKTEHQIRKDDCDSSCFPSLRCRDAEMPTGTLHTKYNTGNPHTTPFSKNLLCDAPILANYSVSTEKRRELRYANDSGCIVAASVYLSLTNLNLNLNPTLKEGAQCLILAPGQCVELGRPRVNQSMSPIWSNFRRGRDLACVKTIF